MDWLRRGLSSRCCSGIFAIVEANGLHHASIGQDQYPVTVPEAGQKATATELSPSVLAIAKLVLLALTALALSGVQLAILFLQDGPVSYAVIAGSIVAAILLAWALGLWRASWFVRLIAAFICVAVTSWPVAPLVVFSACYFGPCRFS